MNDVVEEQSKLLMSSPACGRPLSALPWLLPPSNLFHGPMIHVLSIFVYPGEQLIQGSSNP